MTQQVRTSADATGSAPAGRSLPLHANRQSLWLAGSLLIVAAALYLVATPLLHPGGGPPIAEFEAYADSGTWAVAHALQFASTVLTMFGFLALAHGLNVTTGIRGLTNRFAAATASAAVAVSAALYAVDGVAIKEAANAWASQAPAARPAFLAALEGVRGIEFGLRGYLAYTIGLAVTLLAVVIVSTARVPRGIGYLMALTGLVYIAQGVGWSSLRTVLSEHTLEGNISYYVLLLDLAWAIWLLLIAMRMKAQKAQHR